MAGAREVDRGGALRGGLVALGNDAVLGLAWHGEALVTREQTTACARAAGDGVDARARWCEVLGAGSVVRATRGAERRLGHGIRRWRNRPARYGRLD